MARQVDLTRYSEYSEPVPGRGDAFRIKITASNAVNMQNEIFLFVQGPKDASTGTTHEYFLGVATPDDLVTFPLNNPDTTMDPPFYLKDTIDVLVESREVADYIWTEVQAQVKTLIDALNNKDYLINDETVTIS